MILCIFSYFGINPVISTFFADLTYCGGYPRQSVFFSFIAFLSVSFFQYFRLKTGVDFPPEHVRTWWNISADSDNRVKGGGTVAGFAILVEKFGKITKNAIFEICRNKAKKWVLTKLPTFTDKFWSVFSRFDYVSFENYQYWRKIWIWF